MIKIKITMFV